MTFKLAKYTAPDFSLPKFVNAPDAEMARAPRDKAAPEGFHAMSIFPEYFKVNGEWILPEDSLSVRRRLLFLHRQTRSASPYSVFQTYCGRSD